MPFMTRIELKQADVLFRQGDAADQLYYLVSGAIRFPEIDASAGPGDLIGEVGIFSPCKTRTASALAERDATLLALSDQKVLELYHQDPEFGIYVVRMIIQRLTHQIQAGRAKALAPPERFE